MVHTTERVHAYLIESDNVRVLQQFHDLHFSGNFPSVVCVQPSLVNDLNGHLDTEEVRLSESMTGPHNGRLYVELKQ